MKLAYPAFSEVLEIDGTKIPCLVIENRQLFRSFLRDVYSAMDGNKTQLVLSHGDSILDIPRYAELILDFIDFDPNKKSLISKIISEMERVAVSPENYVKTQELLSEIENCLDVWTDAFSCGVYAPKLSVSSLIRSAGIEIRNDYEGHRGEAEKILDYMDLVREFDRDKLFITVNMRSFFDDDVISDFLKTASSHEYRLLMVESQAYPLLAEEKRTTIDCDLCEF